jgi:hypothetical protein
MLELDTRTARRNVHERPRPSSSTMRSASAVAGAARTTSRVKFMAR